MKPRMFSAGVKLGMKGLLGRLGVTEKKINTAREMVNVLVWGGGGVKYDSNRKGDKRQRLKGEEKERAATGKRERGRWVE